MLVVGVVLVVAGVIAGMLVRSEPAHWKSHEAFVKRTTKEQREEMAADVRGKLDELFTVDLKKWRGGRVAAEVLKGEDMKRERESGKGKLSVVQVKRAVEKEGEDGEVKGESLVGAKCLNEIREGELGDEGKGLASEVRVDRAEVVKLTQDEINMLANQELEKWVKDRGYSKPDEVSDLVVCVVNKQLVVSFDYVSEKISQNFSVYMDYEFKPSGYLSLRLASFDAGRLPVPAKKLTKWASEYANEYANEYEDEVRKIQDWFHELQYFEVKPVLEVKHRRRVRIEGVKEVKDGVELQLRIQDHKTYREMNKKLAAMQ